MQKLWGAAVGVGVTLGSLVLACVARVTSDHASISVVSVALAGVSLAVMAWRWPRLATSAAIVTTFALVPVLFLGSAWALSDPLVVMGFRCGTGDIGLPFVAALIVFVGGALAVPIALVAEKIHRALLLVAAVTVVLSGVTCAFGVSAIRKPEPDAFRALFKTKVSIAGGGTAWLGSHSFTWDTNVTPGPTSFERGCILHTLDGDQRIEVPTGDVCPRLNLLWDSTSDIVLVSKDGDDHVVASFGQKASYGRDVVIADFPGQLGAPRAWIIGGAGGFVFAAFAFARAIAARRRAKNVHAVEGAHLGAGWVKVDDAAPRHVPALAALAPQTVVVLDTPAAANATYRADGAPLELRVALASRESLRAAEYARAIAWSCVAIAAACTSSTPLWASRLFGLL